MHGRSESWRLERFEEVGEEREREKERGDDQFNCVLDTRLVNIGGFGLKS